MASSELVYIIQDLKTFLSYFGNFTFHFIFFRECEPFLIQREKCLKFTTTVFGPARKISHNVNCLHSLESKAKINVKEIVHHLQKLVSP